MSAEQRRMASAMILEPDGGITPDEIRAAVQSLTYEIRAHPTGDWLSRAVWATPQRGMPSSLGYAFWHLLVYEAEADG